jgi:hypothetical protein
MTRTLGWALLAALTLTAVAVIGAVSAEDETVAAWLIDVALAPGFALPSAYWGAVHDPLQFLIAAVLNVVFYTTVFAAMSAAIRAFHAAGR